MKAAIKKSRFALAFLVMLMAFQFNLFKTTSDFQFKTWRDGSEALVLGKIFADANGIDTGHSNLGFIERGEPIKGPNVLAVYKRIDTPTGIETARISDDYWTNGFSNSANKLLIKIADVNSIGYANNEVRAGQHITFPGERVRAINSVERSGPYDVVSYRGDFINPNSIKSDETIKLGDQIEFSFNQYPQQFGIQALALSFAYKYFPLVDSVSSLQFLMSAMMALALTLMIREIGLTISTTFAAVFFVCMVGSPWVVAISRNLYWASFLWFLPTVMAMYAYRCPPSSRARLVAITLYGALIFLKSLAGYEYTSSIVLMSLMVFMIDPFRASPILGLKKAIRMTVTMGGVAVAGFLIAILVHAINRADTLAEGISQTLGRDALKYSALGRLNGVVVSGPDIPLSFLISEYVNEWKTPVLFWLEGSNVFSTLLLLTGLSLVAQFYIRDANARRDAALVLVTLLAPLSWFILMQKHSAIHVHLNYVLWYFGFIPACMFVIVRGYLLIACNLKELRRTT
ncbi:hypothetical protein [Pseudomonas lactucae]|uniref:Glycosyltransferase RgtA/B/C/D-like domain-containing protein n=1 Tax=Pseudomonas lactucae TaxID=2813360 RepID=A0A9X0Y9Y3_9PSED|nr:hypothetical protein [Pseudomonas lactucae]MBN2975176.1 hypothetical protein [Pseudomonas lactucae]MBN2986718.1 hypothetical protein [Pseudomonas lactucae]